MPSWLAGRSRWIFAAPRNMPRLGLIAPIDISIRRRRAFWAMSLAMAVPIERADCRVDRIPWIDPWSTHEPAAGSFRGRVRQNLTSHGGKRQLEPGRKGRVSSTPECKCGTMERVPEFPNTHESWISLDRSHSRREQLWKIVEVVQHDRLEQVRPWIRIRGHHDVGSTDSTQPPFVSTQK
jgi:hypothetical protein